MVQNNKVLTVSYGTFSCTLEGFEDSFGTMKAIAEYFRDLASDDRYFGAEPPQPDAEMLARIAQREVARQVEARTSSEGIHLRAAAATLETAAPEVARTAPEPAAQTTAQPHAAPAQPEPTRSEPETTGGKLVLDSGLNAPELFTDEEETAAQSTPQAPELIEISEAPITEAQAEALAEDQTEDDEPAAAEVAVEATEATLDSAAVESIEESEEESDIQPATPEAVSVDLSKIAAISAAVSQHREEAKGDSSVEAFEAEDLSQPATDPAAREDTVPAVDSIAAKLQRIRAVVAQAPAEVDSEFSEDEHADSISGTGPLELEDTDLELDEDLNASVSDDDEISRVLNQLDLKSEAQDPAVGQEAPQEPVSTSAPAAAPAEEEIAQIEDEKPPRAPASRPRARIVKMKRAELEKAVASGSLQQVSDEAPAAAKPEKTESLFADSSLDEEDEADLMRELAAVEAELLASSKSEDPAPKTSEVPPAQSDVTATSPAEPSTASRPKAAEHASPDSDVNRLMAAAESKLEDPDSTSQRETYKHLRAAVAAETADRSVTGLREQSDGSEPYRADLANVVRPRRPESRSAAPRQVSGSGRPAPLKLVAEQRVDAPAPEPAKVVRPRRVSLRDEIDETSASDETGGFKQYASDCGAAELGELLEAAAAYLSFVEGRNDFSRPQLMNKVRSAGSMQFNREDGLRSFGQLLREGKIERADNGRFAATQEIGFQPSKRAAG